MWSISGRMDGHRYMVLGDQDTVTVPQWLTQMLELTLTRNDDRLMVTPTGPWLPIDLTSPGDVAAALQAWTDIDVTDGQPPTPTRLVTWSADGVVY